MATPDPLTLGTAPAHAPTPTCRGRSRSAPGPTGFQKFLRQRPRVLLLGEVFNLRRARANTYFELRDAEGAVPLLHLELEPRPAAACPMARCATASRSWSAAGPTTTRARRRPRPSFNFRCDHLRLAGEGDLLAQLERSRRKLAADGLLERQSQLARPMLPRTIGVVTARSSAACADLLAGLERRGWRGTIVWADAPVQDRRAAPAIARALTDLAAIERVEVAVVCRGGGSLTDLWAFCDESLCRTVAMLRLPVISAVGHEVDRTLIDDVAAVSCSTPTHAAEALVAIDVAAARGELLGDRRHPGAARGRHRGHPARAAPGGLLAGAGTHAARRARAPAPAAARGARRRRRAAQAERERLAAHARAGGEAQGRGVPGGARRGPEAARRDLRRARRPRPRAHPRPRLRAGRRRRRRAGHQRRRGPRARRALPSGSPTMLLMRRLIPMSEPAPTPATPENYETAVARLEQIIARLDSGEAELRETLALCTEAKGLIEFCKTELDAVSGELQELRPRRARRRARAPRQAASRRSRSASSRACARPWRGRRRPSAAAPRRPRSAPPRAPRAPRSWPRAPRRSSPWPAPRRLLLLAVGALLRFGLALALGLLGLAPAFRRGASSPARGASRLRVGLLRFFSASARAARPARPLARCARRRARAARGPRRRSLTAARSWSASSRSSVRAAPCRPRCGRPRRRSRPRAGGVGHALRRNLSAVSAGSRASLIAPLTAPFEMVCDGRHRVLLRVERVGPLLGRRALPARVQRLAVLAALDRFGRLLAGVGVADLDGPARPPRP